MNRLQKSVRRLWIWAQLSVPPSIRHAFIPRLNDLNEFARLLFSPYVTVSEVSGRGEDGPLTVVFVNAMEGPSYLESILFPDGPIERRARRFPIWRWREIANWTSGDITIVRGAKSLIRRLPGDKSLVLPEAVTHRLDLNGDWQSVYERFHWHTRKRRLPRISKSGYSLEVSHDEQDFDVFYRQMVLPSTRKRHGRLSTPIPRYEAYQYFRHGLLFRIMRDGNWVAGAVRYPDGRTLQATILGVRDADPEETERGVIAALHYESIRWAHKNGYLTFDFLETGPYLESGLFRYKRSWGTGVSVPDYSRRQVWIRIRRETPAVAKFLRENPFVVVDDNDRLHGLIAVDDPANVSAEARREWEKRYAMPGLDSLIARAISSYVQPKGDDLVLPILVNTSRVLASSH